ncbi:macrophage-expressed gene 1 protein-like [Dreissena polymorpha]|uniref:MACPF domain-containing protein n=1 Tax=Dreissena polymorpha TaxID=45954 RepID=A0A9D4LGU1_DREPO|nr:macrophage-expressed gene 1 protein-like [Dreissena polymorpha]KAH3857755.1 hypothetical protein DPMN_100370 [Dreissena polymorpha]
MLFTSWLICALVFASGASADNTTVVDVYPPGDPRHCLRGNKEPRYRFEVLPGGGWDNLRNKDMGMIVKLNFSQCRTTEDGRFLLPDGVYTVPMKASNVETNANLYEHWSNFSSTLSRSVNVDAGLKFSHFGISGSFSDEYTSVKARQHLYKSVTTRVQARYMQYVSHLEPDTPVNEAVKKRLHKIAASVLLNRTDLARFDSQLLVRDFGTHVITSIDVGAALVQIDQLREDYLRKYESQKSTITASASASFFSVFSFDAKYSTTSTQRQIEEYKSVRTNSEIATYGGPVFRPSNYSADAWSDNMANDLVALDKSGDPIYYLANEINLPEVPQSVIYDVYDQVKDAVEAYYEHNAIAGCTKPDSPNFSFQANTDDGSCKPPKTNFTFGGVYQKCSGYGTQNLCAGMSQKNPQTGSQTCPSGYEAVLLQTGSKRAVESRSECHSCWLLFQCCDTNTYVSIATYNAYWCAATGKVPANSGFLFGGLYTDSVPNINTQAKSCPLKYYPLTILGGLVICVSDDYELGSKDALPFAGFFSCLSGNPLALKERSDLLQSSGRSSMLTNFMLKAGAESYPRSCPEGYSQHLAVIDNGCSVHYCIKSGALSATRLPLVKRPPFMDAPRDGFNELQPASVVFDTNGDIWTTADDASNVIPKYLKGMGIEMPKSMTSRATQDVAYFASASSASSKSSQLSGGGIAAISVFATLACVVVASCIVFRVRRRRALTEGTDGWRNMGESRPILNAAASLGYTQINVDNADTTRT